MWAADFHNSVDVSKFFTPQATAAKDNNNNNNNDEEVRSGTTGTSTATCCLKKKSPPPQVHYDVIPGNVRTYAPAQCYEEGVTLTL